MWNLKYYIVSIDISSGNHCLGSISSGSLIQPRKKRIGSVNVLRIRIQEVKMFGSWAVVKLSYLLSVETVIKLILFFCGNHMEISGRISI